MPSKTTQQQKQQDYQLDEDCPICLEAMAPADVRYPLYCPTTECPMNMCLSCIRNMIKAAHDDYQEASDGSQQVKIKVVCPQCRQKYECEKYSGSRIVVDAIVQLRQAYNMQTLLQKKDDDLSASDLNRKASFLKTESLEDLQTALDRLLVYLQQIGKNTAVPPPLDWKTLQVHLPEASQRSKSPTAASTGASTTGASSAPAAPWNDPTLFYGYQDLMSRDEQEFLTQLFVSGQADLLAEAALILQNVLLNGRSSSAVAVVEQLSKFSSTSSGPQRNRNASNYKRQVVDLQKLRKRYPVPPHMPLSVSLPVYHPEEPGTATLKFVKNNANVPDLTLKSVRGKGGSLGLRKGDVVTHMNGQPVRSQFDYSVAMLEAYNNDSSGTVAVVVNASEGTAQALRDRALKMKQDNVRM